MKKLFSLVLSVVLISGIAQAFSLNVDPPSLWLETAANSSTSGSIILENKGNENLDIRVYTEDWLYGKDRSKEFKKAGSLPISCSNWISVYPKTFTVAPGRSQEVKYTATIPPTASGGYYSVIFFETRLTEARTLKKTNITIAGRIGTIVYLETKDRLDRTAELKSFKVSKSKESAPVQMVLTVQNKGNTIINPKGTIIITDKRAKLYARMEVPKTYLLQGETVPIRVKWTGDLEAGEYEVIATVDCGGEAPLTARAIMTVTR